MVKIILKHIVFFSFTLFSFFLTAQTLAPDEDGTPYTTCNDDGANATRTSNDLVSPVNVGTIDDRSCYANYKESTINATTWGIYNITDGSNNQDAVNTLQPRIERALPVASNTSIGTYVKFTGTFRILEVGDTSGTNDDGTYIAQAKGQHTGGGGSADPAICLYLAKPVFDVDDNQIAFDIYAERILIRGGSGASERETVLLKRVNKNEETNFILEVGFRQDPNDVNSKIHYCDATIGGDVFSFNIPEPDRATQSKIRYGAYRVKGGRAQIRWANTSHIKSENGVDQNLGNEEPMITLLGDSTVNIDQGNSYTDSGAIAIDNYDGDLTQDIVTSNPVDINTPGTYTVTYNVSDTNGNNATQVSRTVIVNASVMNNQTTLPGTIEVETGDLSQNNNHYDRNKIGSGNGGTNNIVDNWRKTRIRPTAADSDSGAGVNGTIINAVTVTADGNYDFTFTYFKNSADGVISINSTDASGGSSTTLASFTLLRNDASGTNTATTSSYSTQTVTGVALTTGITYITFTNADSKTVDLDNVIVTAAGAKPTITLLGSTPVNVTQGDAYTDAGATALAGDDITDITGDIVTVNPVDVNTIGEYTVTYNVTNGGAAADEVTRTVNVVSSITNATQTGNWNDTATWGGNSVPGSANDVYVPDGIVITVTDTQAANTLKVTNGANVIIDSGGALSITGDVYLGRFDFGLEVRSLTTVGAMGTLTVGGSVHTLDSDDVTTSTADKRLFVRKTLDNDKWYLVSSMSSKQPRVNRMTNSDFRTNATPAYAVAVYNNANAANSKYEYFSTSLSNSDEVTLGAGMSVSVNGNGNSNTTGEFGYKAFYTHGSNVDIAISMDEGTSDAFNLVGSPFLSNLYGNTSANATNILSTNSGVLAEQTLWFWNADTSTWVAKNHSSDAFTIPPVTGFFVKSNVAGGNFTFSKSMETHTAQGSISSKSNSNRFEIDLSVANGKESNSTSIKFINGMTTSFDNGYDSSMFGGYSSSFEVYTGLVGDDSNKKLAIQSLPNSNFESMIVPVGVTTTANSEITFSAEALNTPDGYNVYLEDRLNNTFTRLDEPNAEYKATVTENTTEGRFYIHVKASVLSADSELLSSVKLIKSNNILKIVGLSQRNAQISVYNILGKQVLRNSFIANGNKEITLSRLTQGVYIVQLETEKGSINKKIVLE